MKSTLALFSTFLLVLASCKKDGNDGGAGSGCSTNVASVSGKYKITSIKYKQTPTSAEIDMFSALNDCEKDDFTILNSNGTLNLQDAGTPCTPTTAYSSTWSLGSGTIVINGKLGIIDNFDCDILTVSTSGVYIAGDKVTVTYDKQ